jgi:hypothetical protein
MKENNIDCCTVKQSTGARRLEEEFRESEYCGGN